MHVGSTLGRNDEQEATDAGVDNDAGPLPRHSHDDDDDDDDWLRGTEGVEQRHWTPRDGVRPWPSLSPWPWPNADVSSFHSEDSAQKKMPLIIDLILTNAVL